MSMFETSWAGHLLVAEPELDDPNFYRSVVLLLTHDASGAFGLILNRPVPATLDQAVPDFRNTAVGSLGLRIGGPVEPNRLFIVHEPFEGEGSWQGGPFLSSHGVYLKDTWPITPEQERPRVLLFAGYSGWGPSQLENEVQQGAWSKEISTPEDVFYGQPSELWTTILTRRGGVYRIAALTGVKPSMN